MYIFLRPKRHLKSVLDVLKDIKIFEFPLGKCQLSGATLPVMS